MKKLHRLVALCQNAAIVFLFALCLHLCACKFKAPTKNLVTYQDMVGRTVRIPSRPARIVSNGGAIDEWILMLNAQDRLVSISNSNQRRPWFRKVFPGAATLPVAFDGSNVNIEELVSLKPDVVYMLSSVASQTDVEHAGIPVFVFDRKDPRQMVAAVNLLAQTLGSEQEKIASQFNAYFDWSRKTVRNHMQGHAQKPLKVYYAAGANPLVTDGKDTLVDFWIHNTGDINLASQHGIESRSKTITMEELLEWNPDVIVTSTPLAVEAIRADSRWLKINAVRNDRIYASPVGVYQWSTNTTEAAIQTLWIATVLHPEQFRDVDMVKETQRFYHQFFRYDLTATDALDILHPRAH